MHSGFLADPVVANGVSGTLCRVKYGLVLFFPYIHIFWIFSLIHISSLLVMPHCHACIVPSLFSSIPIADPIGKCIVAHSFWTFCHFTFPLVITAYLLSQKEIDTINCCFTISSSVVFVLLDLLIAYYSDFWNKVDRGHLVHCNMLLMWYTLQWCDIKVFDFIRF